MGCAGPVRVNRLVGKKIDLSAYQACAPKLTIGAEFFISFHRNVDSLDLAVEFHFALAQVGFPGTFYLLGLKTPNTATSA